MPSILFICTSNQFRSPLAASLLARRIEDLKREGQWKVESAGTWTSNGHPASSYALHIAMKLGLTGLEDHHTRPVNAALLSNFDLCIVMEAGHKEALGLEFPFIRKQLLLLSEVADGLSYDIPDPAKPGVDLNEVIHELEKLVRRAAARIIALAEEYAKWRETAGTQVQRWQSSK